MSARLSAILQLTWDHVDFNKRTIDFRINRDQDDILDTSGQKGRAKVDMNKTLFDALDFAKRYRRCDHVIEWNGKPVKSVKTALKGEAPITLDLTRCARRKTQGSRSFKIGESLGINVSCPFLAMPNRNTAPGLCHKR